MPRTRLEVRRRRLIAEMLNADALLRIVKLIGLSEMAPVRLGQEKYPGGSERYGQTASGRMECVRFGNAESQ